MPAFSVEISSEMAATLGDFREAARQVKREWEDTSRAMTKDIRAGNSPKPEDQERAAALQDRHAFYIGQARQQRVDQELYGYAARTSAKTSEEAATYAEARGEDALRSLDKLADEIAESRKNPLATKAAQLLNTHNPHGAIRQILSGNLRASQFETVGEAMSESSNSMLSGFGEKLAASASSVAAPAFLAALATKEVFNVLQDKADSEKTAAQIDFARQSTNFDIAHQQRFNQSEQMTQYLQQRSAALASKDYHGASNSSLIATAASAYTSGNYLNLIGAGFEAADNWVHGAERKARWDKNEQAIYDTVHGTPKNPHNLLAYRNADALGDWHSYINSAAVQHSQDYTDLGFLGWIKSKTIGKLTGSRDRELVEFAQETAKTRVAALSAELKRQHDEYEADPHNRLNDRERNHHMAIVEEQTIKHFQNWSPI